MCFLLRELKSTFLFILFNDVFFFFAGVMSEYMWILGSLVIKRYVSCEGEKEKRERVEREVVTKTELEQNDRVVSRSAANITHVLWIRCERNSYV